MREDIYKILEIGFPESNAEHVSVRCTSRRTSRLAVASLVSGIAIIPVVGASVLIFETVIYNPPLEALNALLAYTCIVLLVGSVTLGVAGIFRIALSKGQIRGYALAASGIIVSIISSAIYFLMVIRYAFERAMA